MNVRFVFVFVLAFGHLVFPQQGFQFETKKKKVVIPFELINNLIFIPLNVNGVALNFLLDSGLDETILLSLDDPETLNLKNVEKIKLRGLGSKESIEGLKSTHNNISVKGLIDNNHSLYIVLDQSFNFSSHVGIPVNGIIGYSFFKDNLVEINYERKKITVYNDAKYIQRKIKKQYQSIPISIEKKKPYAQVTIGMEANEFSAKLLVDLGNSDAVWLFKDKNSNIKVPDKNLDDFLGMGFSGDVMGKRARIPKFSIAKFEFDNPIIAFPDSASIRSVTMVKNRLGSIGGEILKRFTVIFDYKNEQLFLKKNSQYDLPFQYNKSGIELQNEGMQWVQETVSLPTTVKENAFDATANKIQDFKYKFSLKPIFSISNVRKNSPAAECGLRKGDVLVRINKVPTFKYSLQEINEILKSDEGKWLNFEIERNGQSLLFRFQLKSIL